MDGNDGPWICRLSMDCSMGVALLVESWRNGEMGVRPVGEIERLYSRATLEGW